MLNSLQINRLFTINNTTIHFGRVTLLTGENCASIEVVSELILAMGNCSHKIQLENQDDHNIVAEVDYKHFKLKSYYGTGVDMPFNLLNMAIDRFSRTMLITIIKSEKIEKEVLKILNSMLTNIGLTDIDQLEMELYGFFWHPLTELTALIVNVLSSKNKLILLKYPEYRINCEAQRKLAEFIGEYAIINNLQIIITSHSEYILHGLRMAVNNHKVTKDNIVINYFYNDGVVSTLPMNDEGRLDCWPDGSF